MAWTEEQIAETLGAFGIDPSIPEVRRDVPGPLPDVDGRPIHVGSRVRHWKCRQWLGTVERLECRDQTARGGGSWFNAWVKWDWLADIGAKPELPECLVVEAS